MNVTLNVSGNESTTYYGDISLGSSRIGGDREISVSGGSEWSVGSPLVLKTNMEINGSLTVE